MSGAFSFVRQTWRPTLAALSVSVPLTYKRQPANCSQDVKWAGNISVSAKFVSNVAPEDANVLLEKVAQTNAGGSADTIGSKLQYLWTELVNCENQNKMSLAKAMEYEIPIERIQGIDPSLSELAWLRPVMKWIENPEIMKYLDVDHNNQLSFTEFSILLLLALTQIESDSEVVTKKKFIKSMYFLMDLDGNGEIDKDEFVCICSLLAALGMIDAAKVNEVCRTWSSKRKVELLADEADFRKVFENAFEMVDEDGDKTLSESEWFLFAGEWLRWNLERSLEE